MKKFDPSTTSDFQRIVVENVPLIDIRAPVEFAAGAFPTAVNLPILDNKDRHLVGICYKQKGKEAAFDLAFKRVSGAIKEQRVCSWADHIAQHPDALLYCFRGGMRSKTAQLWLERHSGRNVQRLEGGYKALRRYLIDSLDPANIPSVPVILGGRTGNGKTRLLSKLSNAIDLEGIAHHRGSAFGNFLTPQPTQIDFENKLAFVIITLCYRKHRYMILEDEGSYIGARYIPRDLAAYCKRDSMVLLECDLGSRIETTYDEYVRDAQQQYAAWYGEDEGLACWKEDIRGKVERIRKRLGSERLNRVMEMIEAAHRFQLQSGNPCLHKQWVELLLCEYYDPMYDYQIEKSNRTIVFRGDYSAVLEYFQGLEKEQF